MTRMKIAAAAALASGLLALAQGGAEARIRCDGNFQIVRGQPVSTLYCQERELARVARKFGWRVSVNEIRYSESTKAQVCRAIGFDNRVQEVCSPYQPFGGSNRFNR
ncbi:MAG: hypothetical protein WAN86_20540 [Hyphomicrobiaceae bacterium]